MAGTLLELEKLNRSFGGLRAVQDVTLKVQEGVIKGLIGPNGAGKTTLFNLISGDLSPDSGTVKFLGREITHYKPHRIAAMGLARTFQTTKLFGNMTVLENVMMGRHTQSKAGFVSGMLNLPRTWREEKAIRERAFEFLETLGVAGYANEEAANLPFGDQRAVEFARALAVEPRLLLLDEPAAGLNIRETERLAERVTKIREGGVTVLVVEHDMSLVMDISREVVVLDQGRKLAEGPPAAVQKDPQVIRTYLGEEDA